MLQEGTRLGPYDIVEHVAAGGMGDVYRALDTRLGRLVALKILPPHLAQDRARQRFEQEARSASSLNHPNIVTVYDIGESGGVAYIAMEFVEGRTLRELLADGPLAISLLLGIAVQICDGLTAAHDTNLVHRDLKPENIRVTPDGVAKILDFGIARTGTGEHLSASATMLATEPGVLMGTVGYMSPEQARGEATDVRSDQFSLGAVLYELATGVRAFARRSAVETASAIITDQPPAIESLCPHIPPPLAWAIERCLAKEARDRYASTRELHRDLLAVRDRLSQPSPQSGARVPSNLPATSSALVGREQDVAAITALLTRDDVRWLTLTGPGGVGKTRLCVQAAAALAERFHGAVYFVPLANLTDYRLVASAIAQVLDVRSQLSDLDALKGHISVLRFPILLVIDNFEHVADAAPAVAELLEAAPALKVLVSSRSVLHVSPEREYQVAPLAVSAERGAAPDALIRVPAVALFIERARAVRPNVELTDANVRAIAAICTRLDGLPLAIELAAARIKVLSPPALLSRLEGRSLSLSGGARDLPARQQALRSAIDWSYGLLAPAEQRLFRRLSVFVGGWTIESAEAVADAPQDLELDILDGITALVDSSLARPVDGTTGEPRFMMLETLREYGLDRLDAAGETPLIRKAHAAYCLVVAEEASAAMEAASQLAALSVCDAEHANLRAALQYLTDTNQAEWGLRLAVALFQFWQSRGHLIEGRDRGLALASLPASAAFPELRARARFLLGSIMNVLGDYAQATALQIDVLAYHREMADRRGIAITLNGLAIIQRDDGDYESSRASFEEALGIWREIGDERSAARMLSNLASVVLREGHRARARELYVECRSVFTRLGDQSGEAWSVSHEGEAARLDGDLDGAHALHEEALRKFERLSEAWGVGSSLTSLGHVALDRGDTAGARGWYERALDACQRLGDPRAIARLLESMASAAALDADAPRALTLAGAAAALRQRIGAQLSPADRDALDRRLAPARAQSEASVADAWMTGWGMSQDEAMAFALGSSER